MVKNGLVSEAALRGVLEKSVLKICSKFTREHPYMPKCNLIKLQSNFIEIALKHGCSPVNLLHIFRTPFPKNIFGWLLLQSLVSGSATSKQVNSVPKKWPLCFRHGYNNIVHKSKTCKLIYVEI